MSRFTRMLITVTCVLIAGVTANAAVQYTSTLEIATATKGAALDCNVVNVSSQPRIGTLQIFSGDGSSLSVGTFNSLPPGGSTGISVSSFPGPAQVTVAYCKVTVKGDRNTIRVSLILRDSNGNSVANAEAR